MIRKYCIGGLGVMVILLAAAQAEACDCAGGISPCQEYGRVAAVFVGTPLSVRTAPRPVNADRNEEDYWWPRTFTFSIETSFLGVAASQVEVSTGLGGGDCGYDFTIGKRYVVYAYRSAKALRLTTSICTRTNTLENATEDIEFLRSLQSRQRGVTISAEIRRIRQSVAGGGSVALPVQQNFSLVIEGENERREVQTDADGRFSLTGLSPGKFKISLQLPDELTTYKGQQEQELSITDRGCAMIHYRVFDNGRLSGRVLNPDGQPAAGILLVLMEKDRSDPKTNWGMLERSEKDGRFSFSGIPPGEYLLAVNHSRFPQPNDPTNAYPRTYYPNVTDVSKAEVIKLGAGENRSDLTFRLPTRRQPAIITGKVVWNDGTPVAKALILFREVTYHDPQSNNGIDADDQGYFTINAFIGQTFVIEARSNRPYDRPQYSGPMEHVDPVRVVVSNPTEAVKILLTKLR